MPTDSFTPHSADSNQSDGVEVTERTKQKERKGGEKKNEIPSLISERELAYVNEAFPMFFTVNAVTVGTQTFF